MQTVGIRALKAGLSAYLREIEQGTSFLVTNRGEVVAELRPPPGEDEGTVRGRLRRLAERGAVRLGRRNSPELYPTLGDGAPDGTAQALLDADRADR